MPEVETPEHSNTSNTQPKVESSEGSTFNGQMRRMSNALNLEASTEVETSKADETGSEVPVNAERLPPAKAESEVVTSITDSFVEKSP